MISGVSSQRRKLLPKLPDYTPCKIRCQPLKGQLALVPPIGAILHAPRVELTGSLGKHVAVDLEPVLFPEGDWGKEGEAFGQVSYCATKEEVR